MDINQPDVDPDAHREQLIADADKAQAEADQEKQALLDAVKNDEEFAHGKTEWIELGDVELKVKAYFPGDTVDTVQNFSEIDDGEVPNFSELIVALADVTEVIRKEGVTWEGDDKITEFWQAYYDEHGTNVILIATERVFGPAIDTMEAQAPQSFRR